MTRGFEPVCTNNEARAYFKDKGLTYDDIKDGDIGALIILLGNELSNSNRRGETSDILHVKHSIQIKCKPDGSIIKCFLSVACPRFSGRECISFNEDGFIGFAGWADDGNLNPIKRAFLKWCDAMAEARNGQEEARYEE